MNNLAFNTETFNLVDTYVIDRLFFNLFNNTQPDWVRESMKILAEVFKKENIKELNTNFTACHYYLDLVSSFIQKSVVAYQDSVARSIANKLPRPPASSLKELLLNAGHVLSSLMDSSTRMSPQKKFTDVQTKYEREDLQKINS
jgi:hypothetical protein